MSAKVRMGVARENGSVLCRIALWDCFRDAIAFLSGSLSTDVFERRTSTGSGLFALLRRDFDKMFGQIVSVRVKTPNNSNLAASRHIKSRRLNDLLAVTRLRWRQFKPIPTQ